MSKRVFEYPSWEPIRLRPLDLAQDLEWLHAWVNEEYAYFWGLQNSSPEQVRQEYEEILSNPNHQAMVGFHGEERAFLLEHYAPQHDVLAQHYPIQPGDTGIHVLMAPPRPPLKPHYTYTMFRALLDYVFQNPAVQRVLVEPDIRNRKMFALCARLGFVLDQVVNLPHKTAQVAFNTPGQYARALRSPQLQNRSTMNTIDNIVSPQQAVAHLKPAYWQRANRHLIVKAITEFSHERLLNPREEGVAEGGWQPYVLSPNQEIRYTFRARMMGLHHLHIAPESLQKWVGEDVAELDAVYFIKEFRDHLGIHQTLLPMYLEEVISTLQGSAYKLAKGNPNAAALAQADFQTIEQSMTEGHPCFVANNGRIGFDSSDYRAYAPEAGNTFSLLWLAGHKSKAVYAALEDLPYEEVMEQELDETTRQRFEDLLCEQALDPADYLFIPVHPWQWFNKLASVFAAEIAQGHLVCLGYGPDQYLAQQSVRTLFNLSNPEKFYTKSALSILNMGFMRGLPLYYLGTAPVMARWLEELLYADPEIQRTGFRMLSEVASVSYVNPHFEEFGPHNDYNKMLASLWRESPMQVVEEGQTAMTMAALLHVDDEGRGLLPALIQASGLGTHEWLLRYFEAYFIPLLHCFYRWELVFMPHGENLILVLENQVPVRALLKDITEEACILNPAMELPTKLDRMYAEVPEEIKMLSIFTDIFDDFFRFMPPILEAELNYSEADFWASLAESIHRYQARHPELAEQFARYDVFADSFQLSCLNRLQINNHQQMIDLDDPVARLQFAGKLSNPLAAYRTQPETARS